MELIERYVAEVGRKIWGRNKKDIESELRSLLLDSLEEKTFGKEATEEDIIELLKEFGNPSEVASRYNSDKKYIVGPKYYDIYIFILKIVGIIIPIGLLIGLFANFIVSEKDSFNLFIEFLYLIPNCFESFLFAIGIVTLIFFLIERTSIVEEDIEIVKKDWDPKKLSKVIEKHNKVSIFENIVGIFFIILLLIGLNFFPDKLGIYFTKGSETDWEFIQIFNESAFNRYIPFINILLGMSFILNLILLRLRRQNDYTHLFKMFILVGNLLLLGSLIYYADLINADAFLGDNITQDKAITIKDLVANTYIFILFSIFMITIVEFIKRVFIIIKNKDIIIAVFSPKKK